MYGWLNLKNNYCTKWIDINLKNLNIKTINSIAEGNNVFCQELLNHSNKAANVSDTIFEFELPKYLVDGKLEEYIPIKFHANLISTHPLVIFPSNSMPEFVIENNEIAISKKRIDGSINGYSIIENKLIELKYY